MANPTTIRLNDGLVAKIAVSAKANGRSVNNEIEQRLTQSFATDPIIIGWVKLDRWGELERDEVCDECGQDIKPNDAYVGLVASGGYHGPICGGCATSE